MKNFPSAVDVLNTKWIFNHPGAGPESRDLIAEAADTFSKDNPEATLTGAEAEMLNVVSDFKATVEAGGAKVDGEVMDKALAIIEEYDRTEGGRGANPLDNRDSLPKDMERELRAKLDDLAAQTVDPVGYKVNQRLAGLDRDGFNSERENKRINREITALAADKSDTLPSSIIGTPMAEKYEDAVVAAIDSALGEHEGFWFKGVDESDLSEIKASVNALPDFENYAVANFSGSEIVSTMEMMLEAGDNKVSKLIRAIENSGADEVKTQVASILKDHPTGQKLMATQQLLASIDQGVPMVVEDPGDLEFETVKLTGMQIDTSKPVIVDPASVQSGLNVRRRDNATKVLTSVGPGDELICSQPVVQRTGEELGIDGYDKMYFVCVKTPNGDEGFVSMTYLMQEEQRVVEPTATA